MNLMVRVGRIQLYVIFLIFAGFCAFGERFIHLWVGDTFHASYFVFIFLVFVNVISLTMQIAMDTVYAENKVKFTATRVLISSLIGIFLSIIVAPKYGALGCAAATGVALVLTQILYVDFYQRKMGLDMKHFFKNCHLKILPLLIIYTVAAYFIQRYLPFEGWMALIISMGIYVVGYGAIVWLFLANDDEKKLVLGFIKRDKEPINT